MEIFQAIDINQEQHMYQFQVDDSQSETTFFVYAIPADPNRFFQYTFRKIEDGSAKVEMVTHNDLPEFAQRGIAEVLLPIAANYMQRNIYSSPLSSEPGNFLINASEKIWQRLIAIDSRASYNVTKNCYQFIL